MKNWINCLKIREIRARREENWFHSQSVRSNLGVECEKADPALVTVAEKDCERELGTGPLLYLASSTCECVE